MKRLLGYLSSNWNSYRVSRTERRLRADLLDLATTIEGRVMEVQSLQQRVRELESELAVKSKENEFLANSFEVSRVFVDALIEQHGFRVGERDGK